MTSLHWCLVRRAMLAMLAVGVLATPVAGATNDEIRQTMIRQSLASYPGSCPCPYSTMRNGRACGGRSAYSRPGGYAPLCYPSDISDALVSQYRRDRGMN